MKKITLAFFAVAALAVIGCQKEEVKEKTPATITLNGIYNESLQTVKSAYDLVGDTYNFKWVSGDKFIAQSYNGVDYNSPTLFTASAGDAAQVPFTGTPASGYELGDYAFYPNAGDGKTSYTNNFVYRNVAITPIAVDASVSGETATVTLAGTIYEDIDHPMANIPMIGVKDGNGDYQFTACTGVLKITLANLPTSVDRICLDRLSGSYPLNGSFVFDTAYEIKSSYCIGTPWDVKYMNINAGTDANSDGITDSPRSFYFPLPTGTISSGEVAVNLYSGSTLIDHRTPKVDITLNKGVVTELPTINVVSAIIDGTSLEPTVKFFFNTSSYDEVKWSTAETWDDSYLVTGSVADTPNTAIDIPSTKTTRMTLGFAGYKNGTRVGPIHTIDYYTIITTDANNLTGNFTHNVGASCVQGHPGADAPTTSNFTIALSNNPTLGQVMVTNFDGMPCVNKVPGIYDSEYSTITWDNYYTYFDPNDPYKRFVRSSGTSTKLKFIFNTSTSFYAEAGFGYKTGKNDAGGWMYYYYAGSGHVYTK